MQDMPSNSSICLHGSLNSRWAKQQSEPIIIIFFAICILQSSFCASGSFRLEDFLKLWRSTTFIFNLDKHQELKYPLCRYTEWRYLYENSYTEMGKQLGLAHPQIVC